MATDPNQAEAAAPEAPEGAGAAAAAPMDERAFPRGRGASGDAARAKPAGAVPGAGAIPGAISMPGWFGWQFHLGVGVMALGAAAARAAVLARAARDGEASSWAPPWLLAAGGVLVWGLALAGLGFVALRLLALYLRRPLGDVRLGAARMLTAVALFELARRIGWRPFGVSALDAGFAFSLSLAAYLGAVAATLRLKRDEILMLLGAHAALGAIARALAAVVIGMFASSREPAAPPPALRAPALQQRPAPPDPTTAPPETKTIPETTTPPESTTPTEPSTPPASTPPTP